MSESLMDMAMVGLGDQWWLTRDPLMRSVLANYSGNSGFVYISNLLFENGLAMLL